MVQLQSMKVVNATRLRINEEVERGEIENPEELYLLAFTLVQEDLKRQESEVRNESSDK